MLETDFANLHLVDTNNAVQRPRVAALMQCLEEHDKVIFLFGDMLGYSEFCKLHTPGDIVKKLNPIFSEFAKIISDTGAKHKIELVKLTADCIMVAACSDDESLQRRQAIAMIDIALALSNYLMNLNKEKGQSPLHFRFGINIGPAAKVRCDYPQGQFLDWIGEGVNLAARMEASGLPNQIQISQNLYNLVEENYECAPCQHQVKSYDRPVTYFVVSSKKSMPQYTPLLETLTPARRSNSALSPESERAYSQDDAYPRSSTPANMK